MAILLLILLAVIGAVILARDRYSFEAKDGWYLYIEHSPVICTPYTGKPLFGFEN